MSLILNRTKKQQHMNFIWMNLLPSLHPPILLPVRNTFHPKRLSLLWSYRCEKLEAWSLLRAPAGHHCDCSNTPVVDVGLTAKFVLRYSAGFSFTSPTGNLARSRGQEVRTPTWEGERKERKRRRGKRGQPRDFWEVPILPHAALGKITPLFAKVSFSLLPSQKL